jgi:hypothetical protein
MNGHLDSSGRKPRDFFFFAFGFFGFVLAAAGIVVASVACALVGDAIMLLAVFSFCNLNGWCPPFAAPGPSP